MCIQLAADADFIASKVDISHPPFEASLQGGVFVVLENRTDIVDLPDVCGKIVGALGPDVLTSPLAQWAELKEAGIDPLVCVKATFFTSSVPEILDDVLRYPNG